MEPTDMPNKIGTHIESLDERSVEFTLLKKIDDLLHDLRDKFDIPEEESLLLDGAITGYILNEYTKEQCVENITEHLNFANTDKITRDQILTRISSFLEQKEINTETQTINSNGVLNRITQSFTTPTTLAPTKRVYTEPTTTPSVTPTVGNKPLSEAIPVPPVKVDPYREAPDTR